MNEMYFYQGKREKNEQNDQKSFHFVPLYARGITQRVFLEATKLF